MFLDESKHQYVTLPKVGSWPQADHVFEPDSVWAINAALASKRPLLIRGEPGTGKSQLARAAAAALGRVPLSFVVNARSESRDLQYHYDALARLAEAQTASLTSSGKKDQKETLEALHPRHFLEPGVLWWAFNWADAETQHRTCHAKGLAPQIPQLARLNNQINVPVEVKNGVVVLIDEIDKADADVPNGLLETLGNGGFSVPYVNREVNARKPFPLVILTTNGDRELPPAFLRRCLILKMAFPTDETAFVETLSERGKKRYHNRLPSAFYGSIAEMLWQDRQEVLQRQATGPGQAEYFDMLEALEELRGHGSWDLDEALKELRQFVFQKHAPENML